MLNPERRLIDLEQDVKRITKDLNTLAESTKQMSIMMLNFTQVLQTVSIAVNKLQIQMVEAEKRLGQHWKSITFEN